MRDICAICGKPGFLTLEKVRKKAKIPEWKTLYIHKRNKKHKDYDSNKRKRSGYFRYAHHYQGKTHFCYVGSMDHAVNRIEKANDLINKYDLELELWDAKPIKNKYFDKSLENIEHPVDVAFIIWESRRFLTNAKQLTKDYLKQKYSKEAFILFSKTHTQLG